MTEVAQLITVLKRQLKAQGMTYRDVAKKLRISEPSVKRLFASGRFTLARLVEVCNLLGFSLAELAQEAMTAERRIRTLTKAQEQELVADVKLLLVAVCALNHWSLADMVGVYRLSEGECLQRLLKLDRLRLIDLLPANRIRIRVARDFDWLPKGPIRQHFRQQEEQEFLDSPFADTEEAFMFTHGMLTENALSQLKNELQLLRRKFAELHEQALSAPLAKRRGTGLLFAMREWEPAAFASLRRGNR